MWIFDTLGVCCAQQEFVHTERPACVSMPAKGSVYASCAEALGVGPDHAVNLANDLCASTGPASAPSLDASLTQPTSTAPKVCCVSNLQGGLLLCATRTDTFSVVCVEHEGQ